MGTVCKLLNLITDYIQLDFISETTLVKEKKNSTNVKLLQLGRILEPNSQKKSILSDHLKGR